MEKRELVIIGAGPAGLTASIYAKRAGLDFIILEDNKSFQGFIYQDQFSRRFVFNYFNDEINKWEIQGIEKFKPNNGKVEYVWQQDDPNVLYTTSDCSCECKLMNESSSVKYGTLEMPTEALSPDQLT